MTLGKVIQSEGRFQWIISDILSTVHLDEDFNEHDSPPFNYSNMSYKLTMRVSVGANSIGLLLKNRHLFRPHEVSFSFRMRTGPRGRMEIHWGETLDGYFYVNMWRAPDEIFRRRLEILDSSSLTVYCDLSLKDAESNAREEHQLQGTEIKGTAVNKDGCVESVERKFEEEEETFSQRKSRNKMIEDMKLLLASDEDCDVVLKVKEKEFRAHRNILRARSPVFKSMFSNDSAESQSGEVTISDCDPATFPDFLTYVYTGSSRHVNAENVCCLYTTADKYCLETLKEECLLFMLNNLTVDSFCDFLTLALRHEEKELVELATKFFCDHTVAIIKSVKWQIFLQQNTTVGNELFLKAATK